jgi:endoglucanase
MTAKGSNMASSSSLLAVLAGFATLLVPLACVSPSPRASGAVSPAGASATSIAPGSSAPASAPAEAMAELDAWTAASQMGFGVNIGNTLENTTKWETGWGNPPITREFVENLSKLGFKTVRVPVAWDTYAVDGQISPEKFQRVAEVIDWITDLGMFAVLNIHWDGGWIDSSNKEKYPPHAFARFSPEAEKKYRSYWDQIARYFAGKNEKLLFEALNEETNFENEGSPQKAYATLTRVQQIFIDTVRATGNNNAKRLLIVAGYHTDIQKTCSDEYRLPRDTIPHRLFISVHYYTPWQFCGLTEDADWGKMMPTWGTKDDEKQLNDLFDKMAAFTTKHDLPAFIGEFGVEPKKEPASRVRWMTAVVKGSLARKMVPVLWDTGNDLSRNPPYAPSPALAQVLRDRQVDAR